MLEFLFAFVLVAAVVAVLFAPKRGGVIVLAVAMGGAFWQLGNLVDWHPMFFVYVVFAAAAVKIIDKVTGAGLLESELVLAILDAMVVRWRGGGVRPPPRGGGQQRQQDQRQVQRGGTGLQRRPPPQVFRDQDDDDDD